MSKTWKWILGIVIVLVVAALVAAPFVMHNTLGLNYGSRAFAQPRDWDGGPMMGGRGFNTWNRHPMMGGAGFMPFGGLFMGLGMLLGLAVPLGIVFGIVYGAARLALKHNAPAAAPQPAAPVVVTHPCAKCAFPLEDGWKFCPDCGKKQ